jgi:hypothetical protein
MVNEAANENARYYIRIRGKITGPFALEQLKALREQGRLSQTFEISTDRRSWKSAKSLKGLFGEGRKKQAQVKSVDSTEKPGGDGNRSMPAQSDGWYYEEGGQQTGPVPFDELRRMARSGKIQREDFVWSNGFDEWLPAADVPRLFTKEKRPGHSSSKVSSNVQQGFKDASSGILWTAILNGIRQRFTSDFLEETATAFMRWGGYAMIGAMVVAPLFMAYVAVKQDSIRLLLIAGGAFFGLGVLKYLAQRMAAAVHNLVRSSPSRLASSAFLDSAALLFLSIGVALASGLILFAIQTDDFSYIVPALQALIAFGYAACIALQPEWLNIQCPSDASGGEEGVGVLAFLLKVLLRFAAVNFGVGAILSTAGITIGAILFLVTDDVGTQFTAISLAMISGGMLVAAALFPLLAYLTSALLLIPLDVVNSVLQIPRKLDQISGPDGSED